MSETPASPEPIGPERHPEGAGGHRLLELLALAALAFGIVVVARAWPELPRRIPTHFDIAGQPDGWGGRETVLLLPGASLFLYLMLSAVQRIPARFYNFPVALTEANRARQYRLARELILALKATVMGLFAHITYALVETALGRADGLGPWLVPGWLVVTFGLIGVYVARALRAR